MPPTLAQLAARAEQSYRDALANPELVRGPFAYGLGLNAAVAAEAARQSIWDEIDDTAATSTTEAFQAGQDDGLGIFTGGKPPVAATYATFDGPGDSRTCDLCRSLLGQTVKVGSAEYDEFRPPLHINERHYYRYHAEAPPAAQAFRAPTEGLVKKHGHFITNPEKYKPLKIPAAPSGREFIFRRFKDPDSGEWRGSIEYLSKPERPLSGAAKQTLLDLQQDTLTVPAEAWQDAAVAQGPVAELDRAGYVRIVKTAGDPKTLTVTRDSAAQVEEYVRQQHAGAAVEKIEQAGTLEIGGKSVPQWQVTFRQPDARRVSLNKWGKLAATEAAYQAAKKAGQLPLEDEETAAGTQ